jgi:hypothetical protein
VHCQGAGHDQGVAVSPQSVVQSAHKDWAKVSHARLAAFQTLGLHQTSCAQLTIEMMACHDVLLCVFTTWYISIVPIEQHIFMLPLRSHSAHVHTKGRAMQFVIVCTACLWRIYLGDTALCTHLCRHICGMCDTSVAHLASM